MSRNRIMAIATIVGVAALVAVLFYVNRPRATDSATIRFAANLPMTGPLAKLGVPKHEAFQLAVEEINAKGGLAKRKLALVVDDNKGDPKEGVNILQRLAVGDIRYTYVDITRVAYAAAPVAKAKGIVMFAGSAHPAITEGNDFVFRVFTSGDQETDLLVAKLTKDGVKSIYVLHTNETLGETTRAYLERKFKAKGGTVVGADPFKIAQPDLRTILTKARDSGADRIVLLGYGVTFPNLIKQANELSIAHAQIVGNIGFVGPRVAALDPKLTESMIFTGPRFPYSSRQEGTKASEFAKAYENKFEHRPDYTAAFAYDTLMILASVIEKVGTDPIKVRESLVKVKEYDGASGRVTIRPNGDTITSTMLAKYVGGKVIPVE